MDDVERVAKAIAAFKIGIFNGDKLPDDLWSQYAKHASAAIAVLTAAGWQKVGPGQVVVPREATPEMCEQFYALRHREQSLAVSASDSYRAMIAAAPPQMPTENTP